MTDITQMQVAEQETNRTSSGVSYISKQVFLDSYKRITIWYGEFGNELKRDEKTL
jgi:hypothetical protein